MTNFFTLGEGFRNLCLTLSDDLKVNKSESMKSATSLLFGRWLVVLLLILISVSNSFGTAYGPSGSSRVTPTGGPTYPCGGTTNGTAYTCTFTFCTTGNGNGGLSYNVYWYLNGTLVYTDPTGYSFPTTSGATVTYTLPIGGMTYPSVSSNTTYSGSPTLQSAPSSGTGLVCVLVWTSPGTSTSAKCSVSYPTGTDYCNSNGLSVTVYATPSVVSVSAAANPACNSTTLNATGGTGGTIYWESTTSGGTSTSTAATSQTVNASGTYYFRAYNSSGGGCWGSQGSITQVVNVIPSSLTATASASSVCPGGTFSLSGSSTGAAGSITYSWAGPGGYTSGVLSPGTITPTASGVYTLTASGSPCTARTATTTSVNIISAPVITATATPTAICPGGTLGLYSTPSGGSGTYSTYSWTGPGSYTASVRNPSLSGITSAGAGVYSVVVTDNVGCVSAAGSTAAVTLLAAPTTLASGVGVSSVTTTTATISWTNGNGADRIVVISTGAVVSPTNGTSYSASTTYGSGATTGTNNYVVYNGTGTSVSVTNLTSSTSYTVSVYEYNTGTGCYYYSSAASAALLTNCGSAPTGGTVVVSPSSGGSGTVFNLSLSGASTFGGITYQWYSSPNNSTWSLLTGATNSTYSFTGVSANTYYKCVLTCSSYGSGTATSAEIYYVSCATTSSSWYTNATAAYYFNGTNNTTSPGTVQTWTAPSGVTSVTVDMAGAKGGNQNNAAAAIGGPGGRVQGTLSVTPGNTYYIYVGHRGDSAASGMAAVPAGGSNSGGGAVGGAGSTGDGGSTGGGSTDIRTTSGSTGAALSSRLIVAAGGGGGAYNSGEPGGLGGGLTGGNGYYSGTATLQSPSVGATQTSGGPAQGTSPSIGQAGGFGYGGAAYSTYWGGGGGGGWYGGGGCYSGSGGGGSSYTKASVVTGVTHTQGYNFGDGYIIISAPHTVDSSTYGINRLFIPGVTDTLNDSNMSSSANSTTGYLSRMSLTPLTVYQGGFYSGTATWGLAASYQEAQVWIDFNNDGTFAASEQVTAVFGYSASGTSSSNAFSIAIPNTAPTGTHMMRIRGVLEDNSGTLGLSSSLDPCLNQYGGSGPKYVYGDVIDYYVTVSAPATPCSGTPTPGTATLSPTSGYTATPFTLSVSGFTTGVGGISLQWMDSSAVTGGTWVNISGATSNTYTFTGIAQSTCFKCKVTCAASSLSAVTAVVGASFNVTPSCTPTAGSWFSESGNVSYGCTQFKVQGYSCSNLNDSNMVAAASSTTGYLSRITSISPINLQQGGVYPASVTFGTSASEEYTMVWIDFNDDGTFQTTECVAPVSGYAATHINPTTFNISIPTGAATGTHLMRLRAIYEYSATDIGSAPAFIDPCLIAFGGSSPQYYAGTVTDYSINIQPLSCSGTPSAGSAVASATTGCGTYGSTLSLTCASSGTGISYQWQSSPDNSTWTNVSGAYSSSYSATISSNIYYRCAITCAGSGITSYSTSVYLSTNPIPASITFSVAGSVAGGPFAACYTTSGASFGDTTSGGTWSSSVTTYGSVNSSTGVWTPTTTAGAATITYTSAAGCYITASMTNNTTNPATPSVSAGSNPVCAFGSVTLTDATSGGSWSSGSTSIATVSTAGVVTGVANGTATISYGDGCGYGTLVVTVNGSAISFTPTGSVCAGSSVTISPVIATGGASTYYWSGPGGTSTSGSMTLASVTPTVSGTYVFTMTSTSAGSCTEATSYYLNVVSVPTIGVTPSSPATSCLGNTTNVTAVGAAPTPYTLLLQTFNNGLNGQIGGTWTVNNSGAASAYNWAVVSSPLSNESSVTGDGSAYLTSDPALASSTHLVTSVQSPGISTVGYSAAAISFNYYIHSSSATDASAELDYSVDGGATWSTLYNYYNTTSGAIVWSYGSATQTINLPSGALGRSSVIFRWYYNSTGGYYWILDNVQVVGNPALSYAWSGPGTISSTGSAATALTPTVTGTSVYSVTGSTSVCSASTTVGLTEVAQPTISLSASNTIFCVGTSETLTTSASYSGPGTPSYTWSGPGLSAVTNTSGTLSPFTPTVTATGAYSVTMITATAGCNTVTANTATVSIGATPTVTISAATANLCIGGAEALTASTTGGAGTASYTWSGPGITASTGASSTATFTTTATGSGMYSVSVGYSGTGCAVASAHTTGSVNVVGQPSVTVTASSGTLCSGGSETLSATPSGGTGSASYVWSGPGITTTTGSTPTPAAFTPTATVTTSGAYSVALSYSGAGCTTANATTSVVTVNTQPIVAISSSATNICSGGSQTLTATILSGGIGAPTYSWRGPGIATTTGTSATPVAFTPTVTTRTIGAYSLSVTFSGTGCSTASASTSADTVSLQPSATISASATSICTGGSETLTAAPTGGAGVASYIWSGPGISTTTGATATPVAFTPTASVTTTGAYSLTLQYSGSGCNNATAVSGVVTVNLMPSVSLTESSTSMCSGGSEVLYASITGGSGAPVYAWSGPGISASSGTVATITVNPVVSSSTSGQYSVTAIYADACGTASALSDIVSVAMQPSVTVTASNSNLCSGGTDTLSAMISGGIGSATYVWSGPGITATTGSAGGPVVFTPVVSSVTTGAYTVSVSFAGTGCAASSAQTGSVTVETAPSLGSIAASITNMCTGVTVTLSEAGASDPLTGSNIYTWSGPAGIVATMSSLASTTFIPTSPSYSGVYTLSAVYGEDGCYALNALTSPVNVAVQAYDSIELSVPEYVCAGMIENVSMLSRGGSGTPTYTWLGGPGITTPFTSPAGVFSCSPTVGGAYTVVAVYSVTGCLNDTIVSNYITPSPEAWLGVVSSDWNVGSNWTCGRVPSATDSIIIPSGTSFSAAIGATETGSVNVITVQSFATLSINGGGLLNVTGNMYNYGTIYGYGAINMIGSSAQAISGKGIVRNINIANPAGVSMNSNLDTMFVTGNLQMSTGTLNTKGTVVLWMSDDTIGGPNVNGRVAQISGGTITGKMIMQQYIKGGRRAYRFWGTPFVDSIPLSQLENYIDITGSYGNLRGFTYTPSNSASAFWYDPRCANSYATGSAGDPGWVPFTWCIDSMSGSVQVSADSNMVHRFEGIRLFVRGSQGQGLDGATYTPNPVTVRQWGSVNTGNLSVPMVVGTMTVTGGPAQTYNQKSNPYPSPVDIGTVVHNAWVDSQLYQPYLYVWNPYGGAAGVFVTVNETSLTPYVMSANTSYQVRAKFNHASLTFTESNKVTVPSAELLKDNGDESISLNVYDGNYHIWDMLSFKFNENATDNEDNIDAGKAVNPDLNFYSWSADHRPLARDLRPFTEGKVIPLGLTTTYKQDYIIKVDNINIPAGENVYLHDKLLEKYVLLTQGAEYHFTITKDPATQGDNRFELGLEGSQSTIGSTQSAALKVLMVPNPTTSGVNVTFAAPKSENTSIRVLTVEGICVMTQELGVVKAGTVNLGLDNLAAGVYMVELTSGSDKVVQRVVKE